jgi:hydroxyacylglutathione hydrolase
MQDHELRIEPIPAFKDNYFWLIRRGPLAAIVDPGDPQPAIERLRRDALKLVAILVTHHHGDHIGGVAQLKHGTGATVYGPRSEAIDGLDHRLGQGDVVELLGLRLSVLDLPGHTLGHIGYACSSPAVLFCGDTLFACGCGRLFEGSPQQMSASLGQLAALPADTRVYCAHEYTIANLRFARAVEPGNQALALRQQHCQALRERHEPTVPSTIGEELATNPFMRCEVDEVRAAAQKFAGRGLDDRADVFAALRRWKDGFA